MNPEDLDALSSKNQQSSENQQLSESKVLFEEDPSEDAFELNFSTQEDLSLAEAIRKLAGQSEGNVHRLLGLLRLLEELHREIEDGLFRQALPTNRQALYALLKDMEANGGWPYIPRLRLKQVMHWIEEIEEPEEESLDLD